MNKNKKLFDRIGEKIKLGVKKKDIEETLGMPKNCLSNFLSYKKDMPDKWIEPLQKYADETIGALGDSGVTIKPSSDAQCKKLQEYCVAKKCTVDDLIIAHESKVRIEPNDGFKDANSNPQEIRTDFKRPDNHEIDFGSDTMLVIEKYTRFPIKERPTNPIQRMHWDNNKKKADGIIREQWNERKK